MSPWGRNMSFGVVIIAIANLIALIDQLKEITDSDSYPTVIR